MSSILRLPNNANGGEHSPIDPSKVLSGKPQQKTHNLYNNGEENFFCGVWSSDSGKWTVNYGEDEFCYMISGNAIITDAQGNEEQVSAGDAFVVPAGFNGTWETVGNACKFYAIYEA